MSHLEPLHNRVIVLPDPSSVFACGGLFILSEASRKPATRGTVLQVGEGRLLPGKKNEEAQKRAAPQLKVGDKVLFHAWAHDPEWSQFKSEVDGKEVDVLVIEEREILAVCE
jgi:co-chaperonin GroES (HSP10)